MFILFSIRWNRPIRSLLPNLFSSFLTNIIINWCSERDGLDWFTRYGLDISQQKMWKHCKNLSTYFYCMLSWFLWVAEAKKKNNERSKTNTNTLRWNRKENLQGYFSYKGFRSAHLRQFPAPEKGTWFETSVKHFRLHRVLLTCFVL